MVASNCLVIPSMSKINIIVGCNNCNLSNFTFLVAAIAGLQKVLQQGFVEGFMVIRNTYDLGILEERIVSNLRQATTLVLTTADPEYVGNRI